MGLAGFEWDGHSGGALDALPERPERRYAGDIPCDQMHSIVRAGWHAGSAAGTRLGDQQRAVLAPVDGIGRAGRDALCADATLAAGIGDVQPVEHYAVHVDARLPVTDHAGFLADRAAFLTELRVTHEHMRAAQ